MTTNPLRRRRNGRHVAGQAVIVPTKASIPVSTVDGVFNHRSPTVHLRWSVVAPMLCRTGFRVGRTLEWVRFRRMITVVGPFVSLRDLRGPEAVISQGVGGVGSCRPRRNTWFGPTLALP